MSPQFFGYCALIPLVLAVKYPRELLVSLLYQNFGASIDGVNIGQALGCDVGICGVL